MVVQDFIGTEGYHRSKTFRLNSFRRNPLLRLGRENSCGRRGLGWTSGYFVTYIVLATGPSIAKFLVLRKGGV